MTTPELARAPDGRIAYQIDGGTQLAAFMCSTAPVQIIQGPVGSAKSKTCNLKVWSIASQQRAMRDGIRRSRWGVVRNTYPELKTTTIRTWEDTFPQSEFGIIKWSMPISQVLRMGDVEAQVDFLALDKVDDVKKIRSGEYTGFYVNELQYLPKELFDEMTSRAGRYPAMKDGGPSWYGVLADMNAPDEDHFIAMMTGQVEWPLNMPDDERAAMEWPKEWDFFMQPAGLLEENAPDGTIRYSQNPRAENLKWLPPGYYLNQIKGKSRAWIKSRILNKIALVVDGSAVYPNFRPEFHVSREALLPVKGHEVLVAIDPGRWPAAIFMQEIGGRVYVQYELLGFNEPATVFAPKVKRFLEQRYLGFTARFVGDPKGFDKGQATDDSAYDIFGYNGMKVAAAPVKQNQIETRVNALSHILDDNPSGIARFQISPLCRTTKVGLEGKYFLEKDESGVLKPCKNRYSHPCNAVEYGLLGLGEGRRMVGINPATAMAPARMFGGRRTMRRVTA
jgi:hypothetical protein